jgi:hypothetical protein
MLRVDIRRLPYPYYISKSAHPHQITSDITKQFSQRVSLRIEITDDTAITNADLEVSCYFQYQKHQVKNGIFKPANKVNDLDYTIDTEFIAACKEQLCDPLLLTYQYKNISGVFCMIDPGGYINHSKIATISSGQAQTPDYLKAIEKSLLQSTQYLEYSPNAITHMLATMFYSDEDKTQSNTADAYRSMIKSRAKELVKYWPTAYSIQSVLALNPCKQHNALGIFPGSRHIINFNPVNRILAHVDATLIHNTSNFLNYGIVSEEKSAHLIRNVTTERGALYFHPNVKSKQYLYQVEAQQDGALNVSFSGAAFHEPAQQFAIFTEPHEHRTQEAVAFFYDAALFLEDGSIYPVTQTILSRQDNNEMFSSDIHDLDQERSIDASQYASLSECIKGSLNDTPEKLTMLYAKEQSLYPQKLPEIIQQTLGLPSKPVATSTETLHSIDAYGLSNLSCHLITHQNVLPLIALNPRGSDKLCISMDQQPVATSSHDLCKSLPQFLPYKKSRATLIFSSLILLLAGLSYFILEKLYWQLSMLISLIVAAAVLYRSGWLRYASSGLPSTPANVYKEPAVALCTQLSSHYCVPQYMPSNSA